MRLLFDQTIAPRLVSPRLSFDLADLYLYSAHVRHVRLERAHDDVVWRHAKAGGFAIVTKDDDFGQLSFVFWPPPKVSRIRLDHKAREILGLGSQAPFGWAGSGSSMDGVYLSLP